MKTKNLLLSTLIVFSFSCKQINVNTQNEKIPVLNYVPSPSEMNVKKIVSGRVSTLQEIEIYNVGKNIPFTYAGDKISNTPGYTWYVSKHFALKTDFKEDQVQLYLNLLEMSWPHYVEIFGSEPPNCENQRLTAVYSGSRFQVGIAMKDDGFTREPHGGGECMYYNRVGYNFKSARAQHQRYIVIHETCHAFQMALMENSGWTPLWFLEGVADGVAHHTYDPIKKQLNLMNFDRGCDLDYIKYGLIDFEKAGRPSIEEIVMETPFSRGISFLLIHFMMDNPEYSHIVRLFPRKLVSIKSKADDLNETSLNLLKSLSKDFNKMEADFVNFINTIDKTFNVEGGAWEQDGNSYFVRFYNPDNGIPRLNILLNPADESYYKLMKVDQPLPDPCELVGEVARGIDEPSVGLKIDFKKDHLNRGKIGLGFGLMISEKSRENKEKDSKKGKKEKRDYNMNDDELFEVMIEEGNKIIFDGTDFGGSRIAFAFSQELMKSLESQDNPVLGLNVKITQAGVQAVLATGENAETKFTTKVAISEDVREKLMNRNMAILAEDNNHRITPYFDDGRDKNPYPVDLNKENVTNPFRDPNAYETTRLYHAVSIMGEETPQSVSDLLDKLIDATDKSPIIKSELSEILIAERENIAESLSSNNKALEAFSGLYIRFEWLKEKASGERPVNAVLYNPGDFPVTGEILFEVSDSIKREEITISANSKYVISHVSPTYDDFNILTYNVKAEIYWAGQKVIVEKKEDDFYPWSTMKVIKPVVVEDNVIKVSTLFRAGLSGESTGTVTYEVFPTFISNTPVLVDSVDIDIMTFEIFEKSIKLKEGADLQNAAIDIKYTMSLDGEPLIIKKRLQISN